MSILRKFFKKMMAESFLEIMKDEPTFKRMVDDAVEEQLTETDYSGALRGIVNEKVERLLSDSKL